MVQIVELVEILVTVEAETVGHTQRPVLELMRVAEGRLPAWSRCRTELLRPFRRQEGIVGVGSRHSKLRIERLLN